MSRSEYTANKNLANSAATDKSTVKSAPVGYVTGPVIRGNEKPAETKLGDINDPSTWDLV